MLRTPLALLFALAAFSLPAQPATPVNSSHPFLFLSQNDILQARARVSTNALFRAIADELTLRATTNRLEDLPPLEREWWPSTSQKPWSDTYPEIFHHTWIVPLKWAGLVQDCARAGVLSQSSELLQKGRLTMLCLADYTYEFEHYDVGMNYTIWTMPALDAYDLLFDTFTPDEHRRLDAFFLRFLDALRKNDDYWVQHEPGGKLNNHYAWHKLGLSMIGVFYNRPELVDNALTGPKGIDYMLEHGLKDDGLWLEGAIPYQFAATTPMLLTAQVLQNARHSRNLFTWRTSSGKSLKQAYDALLPLLFPDASLPAIGDCYGRRPLPANYPDWEFLCRQFPDPQYTWLLSNRNTRHSQALFSGAAQIPKSPPPPQFTKLWPQMGYVALRSQEGQNYWAGDGWTVFATFSGQPVHEHADKLSIILFNRHLWLPDCEAIPSAEHAFSSTTQSRLNRQTLCHNTVVVDGQSQRFPGRRLDLLSFSNTPALKQASFGDLQGALYGGVRQLRTIVVCPNYVLDSFQLSSDTHHEFAWLAHVDARPVDASLQPTNHAQLPSDGPWHYLREPKSAGPVRQSSETFVQGRHSFRIDLRADYPMHVIHCLFPKNDSRENGGIPMRIFKTRGTNASFFALYRVDASDSSPPEFQLSRSTNSTIQIRLRLGPNTSHHTIPSL